MTAAALLLVLTAALIHAGWNLLLKVSGDKVVFATAFLAAQVLSLAPYAGYLVWRDGWPQAGWSWVLLAAPVHFVYFHTLARGYRSGELSAVYPLARGVAPPLVVLWGLFLFGEWPSALGSAGVGAITAGLLGLGLQRSGAPLGPGTGWALLAGSLTSVYTVLDGSGARAMGPVLFHFFMTAATLLWLLGYGLASRTTLAAVRELRVRSARLFPVGALGAVAYIFILLAMEQSPVGYVAAAREASILFALMLATAILREPLAPRKVWGTACIVSGIVFLRLS